jgi:hypothetical protein
MTSTRTAADTGGVVIDGACGQYWAWAALRLVPVAAPGASRRPAPVPGTTQNVVEGYVGRAVQAASVGELHLHQYGHEPLPDDRPWLRSLWEVVEASEAVVELRYVNDPGASRVDAFLVGRTTGPTRDAAAGAALRLRHELAAMLPAHLAARPLTGADEVLAVLAPCHPHLHGLAEIRKAVTTARTTRAGGPWLAAVTPWRGGRSWEPPLAALAALDFRASVSVGLMSYRIGPGLRHLLADRAARMAALAAPAGSLTAVYGGPQPPDQFAVAARPVVAEAVGRYTGAAFQIRVSLVAEQPVTAQLAATVAAAISPGTPGGGIAGAPAVVVRPAADESHIAWGNITGLNFEPLPVSHLQSNTPESIGDVEQVLGAIADIDETAVAFRLPYHLPSRSSASPTRRW